MENGKKKELSANITAEMHACQKEQEIWEQASEDGCSASSLYTASCFYLNISTPKNIWVLLPIKTTSVFSLLSQNN